MKPLLLLLLFTLIQATAAQPLAKQSDKLKLSVITHDGKPESWLEFYIHNKQRRIPIQASFNISHVRAAIITDMHAVENKCGKTQTQHIAYFSFDPALNLKQFKTRINKPCIFKRKAKLKLEIATKDDKRYYTTQVFKLHPNSPAGRGR